MPDIGQRAPEFTLADQSGTPVSLASLLGRTVVLFFYPKADTSGCSAEACAFRDDLPLYTERDAAIVGISPDPPKKQLKFQDKYELPYTLLCDTEHEVATAYGVWVEKSMYGRKYMGIARTTFVIDSAGVIISVFRDVKVTGHSAAVLDALTGAAG